MQWSLLMHKGVNEVNAETQYMIDNDSKQLLWCDNPQLLMTRNHSLEAWEQLLSGDASCDLVGNKYYISCGTCYAGGRLLALLVGYWRSHTPSALFAFHPVQAKPSSAQRVRCKDSQMRVHQQLYSFVLYQTSLWPCMGNVPVGPFNTVVMDVCEACLNFEVPMSQMYTPCRSSVT